MCFGRGTSCLSCCLNGQADALRSMLLLSRTPCLASTIQAESEEGTERESVEWVSGEMILKGCEECSRTPADSHLSASSQGRCTEER